MACPPRIATLHVMAPENTDQQQFDEQVNRNGKVVLEVLAGLGVFAALLMSVIALLQSNSSTNTTTVIRGAAAAPTTSTLPTSATATIDHTTFGCHLLDVAGTATPSP